ncbi:hypothetical protein CYY_002764 [Polysphondylium violaceum]|uniref:carnosine N-methyltransferase n=1 Tax=Polysphondylium violaceum TaxID=133409 RepID=A0A8J4UUU3_9MYCE|nr:hypothetical protein CYY_002764 [Polysphondylium violaceum]
MISHYETNLNERQKTLLPNFSHKTNQLSERININQNFFTWVVRESLDFEINKLYFLKIRHLNFNENNNNNNNSNINIDNSNNNNCNNNNNNNNNNNINNNNFNYNNTNKIEKSTWFNQSQRNSNNININNNKNSNSNNNNNINNLSTFSENSSTHSYSSNQSTVSSSPLTPQSNQEEDEDEDEEYDVSTTNSSSSIPGLSTPQVMDRLKNILLHLVRDWSLEGLQEREDSYALIIQELNSIYVNVENKSQVKVLCPSAGLGRLPYEIAAAGYCTELNEETLFMILPIYKLFQSDVEPFSISIYPFIHQTKNVEFIADQLREVKIPDIQIDKSITNSLSNLLCIAPGDFFEHYENQYDSFDSVCTSFFIDTQTSVFRLIETIFKILKPGGTWINNGPLFYHNSSENSIHLSKEELFGLFQSYGFQIMKEKLVNAQYTENIKSMYQINFKCWYFVVQKPIIDFQN